MDKYIIVSGTDISMFKREVNIRIKEGYEVSGGLVTSTPYSNKIYEGEETDYIIEFFQTMVLKKC